MLKHAQQKVFLHPGDFCFTNEDIHIHTLLGSCVSITLWHPHLNIGGMCHFALPESPEGRVPGKQLNGRFADDVMEMFRRAAVKHGTLLPEYQGKIFGGGNMMKEKGDSVEDSIGTRNASAAMLLLMQENIEIQVAHVGEFGHRRVVFDPATGEVWVRHVEKNGVRLKSINGKI